jgi:hypothetical protein
MSHELPKEEAERRAKEVAQRMLTTPKKKSVVRCGNRHERKEQVGARGKSLSGKESTH